MDTSKHIETLVDWARKGMRIEQKSGGQPMVRYTIKCRSHEPLDRVQQFLANIEYNYDGRDKALTILVPFPEETVTVPKDAYDDLLEKAWMYDDLNR